MDIDANLIMNRLGPRRGSCTDGSGTSDCSAAASYSVSRLGLLPSDAFADPLDAGAPHAWNCENDRGDTATLTAPVVDVSDGVSAFDEFPQVEPKFAPQLEDCDAAVCSSALAPVEMFLPRPVYVPDDVKDVFDEDGQPEATLSSAPGQVEDHMGASYREFDQTSFKLPHEVHAELRELANKTGQYQYVLATMALEEFLADPRL